MAEVTNAPQGTAWHDMHMTSIAHLAAHVLVHVLIASAGQHALLCAFHDKVTAYSICTLSLCSLCIVISCAVLTCRWSHLKSGAHHKGLPASCELQHHHSTRK